MNLTNLNLVELNAQDLLHTDGGTIVRPIGLSPEGMLNVTHTIVDVINGIWNGIVGRD